jgi:large subunit ribosomal protein L13
MLGGRLATEIARRLRGKHKPQYTPHVDTGDYMVVVNAEKVRVTGNKLRQDVLPSHRLHRQPASKKLSEMLDEHPERVIEIAVKGMLPRNPLGRAMYQEAQGLRRPGASPSGAAAPAARSLELLEAQPANLSQLQQHRQRRHPSNAVEPNNKQQRNGQ